MQDILMKFVGQNVNILYSWFYILMLNGYLKISRHPHVVGRSTESIISSVGKVVRSKLKRTSLSNITIGDICPEGSKHVFNTRYYCAS